jgi:hypothetical protein
MRILSAIDTHVRHRELLRALNHGVERVFYFRSQRDASAQAEAEAGSMKSCLDPICFPACGTWKTRFALATRHVDDGRRIVAQQRKLISEGFGGRDAAQLLKALRHRWEADLDRLLGERVK